MERYCEICMVTKISSTNKRQKYCGNNHYKRICPTCKKDFFQKCQMTSRLTRYCSRKCTSQSPEVIKKMNESRAKLDYQKKAHENLKKALMKKYGVENPSQVDFVKEKKKLTGPTGFARPEFSQIMKEKYGVTNISQLESIKERKKNKSLEKYSVDNVSKSDEVKQKIKNTTYKNYGVESILSLPETQKKLLKTNTKRISKTNLLWKTILEKELDQEILLEYNCGAFLSDLAAGETLIEINPTISHSSNYSYAHLTKLCTNIDNCKKHPPRDKNYHINRFIKSYINNYILFQYFEFYSKENFIEKIKESLFMDPINDNNKKIKYSCKKASELNILEKEFIASKSVETVITNNKNSYLVKVSEDSKILYMQKYVYSKKFHEWILFNDFGRCNEQRFLQCIKEFSKICGSNSIISVNISYESHRIKWLIKNNYNAFYQTVPQLHELDRGFKEFLNVYDCGNLFFKKNQ